MVHNESIQANRGQATGVSPSRALAFFVLAGVLMGVMSSTAIGQATEPRSDPAPVATGDGSPTASLYLDAPVHPAMDRRTGDIINPLSPAIEATSLLAVRIPEPREFALHDLVTIIVRESAENSTESTLETSKEASVDAAVEAFIDLSQLLEMRVRPAALAGGAPQIASTLAREFSGDGESTQRDTMTTRVTAEIIDIKPNGNLVVEARKYLRTNKETMRISLTGVCRPADIAIDNTILSTQLADLRVVKQHEGTVANAAKKGLLTRLFDFLLNF